ncbi:MAG: type II toxin-antitoxin system Phd/YefM family antitoxin [Candidatus Levybacteria bacterium]|nr:type II toxin-antitoxin system Phd/YefM family antitoxin [Candidatus Levybacteria bacterium]
MITPGIITTRQILRSYKEIFERVKKTKEPLIVVSKKKPQVAIVNLDDLEELKKLKNKRSTKALLDLAGLIPKGSGLPSDLSEKHNEYTWD